MITSAHSYFRSILYWIVTKNFTLKPGLPVPVQRWGYANLMLPVLGMVPRTPTLSEELPQILHSNSIFYLSYHTSFNIFHYQHLISSCRSS